MLGFNPLLAFSFFGLKGSRIQPTGWREHSTPGLCPMSSLSSQISSHADDIALLIYTGGLKPGVSSLASSCASFGLPF
jgi:hypothetical protein